MSGRHPGQQPRVTHAVYSLEELASEADVTPRTIRYYISEGLLPPPDSPGRNARYSQDHLDRLRLIASMKERYLPLKEIRRTIAALSPEQIRRRAQRESAPHAMQPRQSMETSSAKEYVAHLMEESAAYRQPARRSSRQPVSPRPADADRPWRRIPIGSDAELLVAEDAWQRRGEQLESALDWIRRILNEEKGPRT